MDVKIITTPGHAKSHISFLVKTEKGNVLIAGDLWWWKDDEKQETERDRLIEKDDPYVKDKDTLIKTREKMLKMADYIIPGHGKMFKVNK
jgi:glyoxylase-like metal-dependent hydrolase (beta-lactamase superfamily II)